MQTASGRPRSEERVSVPGDTAVIAHRGLAAVNPENTLSAFTAASRHPDVDTVELDVMPTADGEVVVFHDDTPARVTDAPAAVRDRAVWAFDYEELASFEVLGTGESVPLLADVLTVVPSTVSVNVELKHPGRGIVESGPLDAPTLADQRDVWRGFVADVVDVLDRHDHDYLLSSFHEGALAAARDVAPSLPLGAVFLDGVEEGLTVARRHDVEYFHLPRNMVVGTSLFDEPYVGGPYEPVDLVEVAHEEGRRVNVWTITDPEQGAELARAGVDGLITDLPGVRPDLAEGGSVPAVDGAD
jgi:glycerophosphoryl diester phosphodiesterase